MKKSVLLVAELGSGLGHIAPLTAIGEKLAATGNVDCVLVVRNSIDGRYNYGSLPFPLVNAPQREIEADGRSQTGSYSEILSSYGFARHDMLSSALEVWDDVFAAHRADLVIADHSPTAILAARGRVPVMHVGSPFSVPPAALPNFPALIAGHAIPASHSKVLACVNDILDERKAKPLKTLPEMLTGEARAVFGYPELDPYEKLRNEPMLGAYNPGARALPPPKETRIFFYGGGVPEQLEVVVAAIAETGIPAAGYFGKIDSIAARLMRLRGMEVFEDRPSLEKELQRASLVISHGGAGLSASALAAGRPQLILPIHLESQLTAYRIEKLGVGLALEKNWPQKIGETLEAMAATPTFARKSQEVAAVIADQPYPDDPVGEAANRALELLGR